MQDYFPIVHHEMQMHSKPEKLNFAPVSLPLCETFSIEQWWAWSESRQWTKHCSFSDLLVPLKFEQGCRWDDCPMGTAMLRLCGNPAKPPLFIARFALPDPKKDHQFVSCLVKGPIRWSNPDNLEALQYPVLVDFFKQKFNMFSTQPFPVRGLRTGAALPWMLKGTIEENKRAQGQPANSDWMEDDTAFLFMKDPGAGQYRLLHPFMSTQHTGNRPVPIQQQRQRTRTSVRCMSYTPAKKYYQHGAMQLSEWLMRSEHFDQLVKTSMLDRYLEILIFRKALRVTDNNNTNIWVKMTPSNQPLEQCFVHGTSLDGTVVYTFVSIDETMDRMEVKRPVEPLPQDQVPPSWNGNSRERHLLMLYSGKPPKRLLQIANDRLYSAQGIEHFSRFLAQLISYLEMNEQSTTELFAPSMFRILFGETRGRRIHSTVINGAKMVLRCLHERVLVLK